MRARFTLPCIAWALLSLGSLRAATADPTASTPQLTVQLLVPPAQIYPGQRFTAGLYFKLEPGWHVYWRNAGDSGEAPKLTWSLPPGIAAGALQFPVPKRLPVGPLLDYGYEDEVLFPAALEVAHNFPPAGGEAVLAAAASWVVCREICIPGNARLAVSRPVRAAATPAAADNADAALVAHFVAAVPQPLPLPASASFRSAGGAFVLTVRTGRREADAAFFPFDQNLIANAASQQAEPLADGVRLTLRQDENLRAAPRVLRGVLVLDGGRAFQVRAEAAPGVSAARLIGLVLAGLALLAFVGMLLARRRRAAGARAVPDTH
jgi:thiol:disulfide interchange protein DsbD